ncbi:MAG TPA: MFS transporter [Candidatus Saccharimonadales bacterium]|nr:MFS transporter [Candidatus Saccharimonadales bacterium]
MKRLLAKIYLYRIFSELMLLYPLYNVMFAERGGLSTFQISSLLGIWSAIILVCEIPAGALADKYARRNLLGVAQIIRAFGYAIWVFVPTYWGFLAGLALWGVCRAMTSGTFEALVFDELKAAGKEQTYAKVLGRSESFALFFSLGSTLLAAPAFVWSGFTGVLWFSVAATVLSSVVAFTLPVKKRQESAEKSPAYLLIIRQAAREVRLSPTLLRLIAFGVFAGVLFRIFDEYASLIIKAAGVPTGLIPIISVAVFLPVIVADFFAYKLEHLRQIAFMIFILIAGIAFVVAGKYLGPAGIVFFAFSMLLIKGSITIFSAKVQHAITGATRATVTSINSFGVEVAAVVAFFAYGLAAHAWGTRGALVLYGAIACAVGLGYIVLTRGKMLRGRASKV